MITFPVVPAPKHAISKILSGFGAAPGPRCPHTAVDEGLYSAGVSVPSIRLRKKGRDALARMQATAASACAKTGPEEALSGSIMTAGREHPAECLQRVNCRGKN